MIDGALATYEEVAQRLHMTPAMVRMTERRALYKLRRDPVLQRLAQEQGLLPAPFHQGEELSSCPSK